MKASRDGSPRSTGDGSPRGQGDGSAAVGPTEIRAAALAMKDALPSSPPELKESKPTAIPPTPDQERLAIAASIAQNPESTPSPTASPGGALDEGTANLGRIEADRKAALEALEQTEYGKMTRRTGGPYFTAAELKLLDSDPAKLNEKKQAARENLVKRASAWRTAERERIDREVRDKLAAAAKSRAVVIQSDQVRELTGREPYEMVNGAVELGQLARVLDDDATILKFTDDEVRKLSPDTALVLLKYPTLRKWLLVEVPEVKVAIGLALVIGPKLVMYTKLKRARAAERKAAATAAKTEKK